MARTEAGDRAGRPASRPSRPSPRAAVPQFRFPCSLPVAVSRPSSPSASSAAGAIPATRRSSFTLSARRPATCRPPAPYVEQARFLFIHRLGLPLQRAHGGLGLARVHQGHGQADPGIGTVRPEQPQCLEDRLGVGHVAGRGGQKPTSVSRCAASTASATPCARSRAFSPNSCSIASRRRGHAARQLHQGLRALAKGVMRGIARARRRTAARVSRACSTLPAEIWHSAMCSAESGDAGNSRSFRP